LTYVKAPSGLLSYGGVLKKVSGIPSRPGQGIDIDRRGCGRDAAPLSKDKTAGDLRSLPDQLPATVINPLRRLDLQEIGIQISENNIPGKNLSGRLQSNLLTETEMESDFTIPA
jgi:hypothetical protein